MRHTRKAQTNLFGNVRRDRRRRDKNPAGGIIDTSCSNRSRWQNRVKKGVKRCSAAEQTQGVKKNKSRPRTQDAGVNRSKVYLPRETPSPKRSGRRTLSHGLRFYFLIRTSSEMSETEVFK